MKYKRVSVFEILTFYNKVFAIQDVSMTIQDLGEKLKKKQCYTKLVKVATRQKLKIKKEYLS